MHHPIDRITHITAFVIPVVEDWLDPKIAQFVHYEVSIPDPSHHERTSTTELQIRYHDTDIP